MDAKQLRCNRCGKWHDKDDWIEAEMYCEDCGSHPAIRCPNCCSTYDTVMLDLEERTVAAKET